MFNFSTDLNALDELLIYQNSRLGVRMVRRYQSSWRSTLAKLGKILSWEGEARRIFSCLVAFSDGSFSAKGNLGEEYVSSIFIAPSINVT